MKNFLEFEGVKKFTWVYNQIQRRSYIFGPQKKELGARIIVNLEKLYLSLKKLDLSASNIDEYYKFSHEIGIAQKIQINLKIKYLAQSVILNS